MVVFHFWINTSRTIVIFHNHYLSDDKNIKEFTCPTLWMKSAVREIFYGWKLDPKDTKHFKAPFHNASQNLISSLSRLKLESVDHTFFKNSNRKTSDPLKYLSPICNLNCHSMEKHFFSQKESFNCLHMCLLAINLSNLCIENMH